MGISVQENMKSTVDSYFEGIHNVGHCFSVRFSKFWMHNDHIYNLTENAKLQQESVRDLHNLTSTIIKNRREISKNNNNIVDETDDNADNRKYAMLDLLLKHEKEGVIDHDGIRQEVDTFMFAVNVNNGYCSIFNVIDSPNYDLSKIT